MFVGYHPDAIATCGDPALFTRWWNRKHRANCVLEGVDADKSRFTPADWTHTLLKPNAKPEHASSEILTLATILLVAGSIRTMSYGLVLATQTALSVTRTQSAVPPMLIVTDGFIEE
jgi:hypothetical protein